jgi:hypothetical protein
VLADDLPRLLSTDPYDVAALARLWRRTDLRSGPLPTPCRVWTGASNSRFGGHGKPRDAANRYGCIGYGKKNLATHRLAYLLLVGEILPGRQVHHRCEVTLCWAPDHLAVTTPRENLMASDTPARRNAERETCRRHGHPLTPENVRLKTSRTGSVLRACLACEALHNAAWRAANRDRVNAQRRIREGRARVGDEVLAASPPVRPLDW